MNKRIEERIKTNNKGVQRFSLTEHETYYYTRFVVKQTFVFVCILGDGIPKVGYFFPNDTGALRRQDIFGNVNLDGPPCHAIRIMIPDPALVHAPPGEHRPQFSIGVLHPRNIAPWTHSSFAYADMLRPRVIPYWQAAAWESTGLSIPPSAAMRRAVKNASKAVFDELGDVSLKLKEKHKFLLIASLLYDYWEENQLPHADRVCHIINTGLKTHLDPAALQNYCGEAGLEPLSRSQMILRIESIVKGSVKHFKNDPDSVLDADEAIRPCDQVHFALPNAENSTAVFDTEDYRIRERREKPQPKLTPIAKGGLDLPCEWVDVHDLIGLTIYFLGLKAEAKSILLEEKLAANHTCVCAHSASLSTVVLHLVDNAVKFTPRGGRITISTRDEGSDHLRIDVTDSGIGIKPEVIERLFLPLDPGLISSPRRVGYLGLGLYLARRGVALLGGHISAQSLGRHQGTTFTVILPGAVAPPAPKPGL